MDQTSFKKNLRNLLVIIICIIIVIGWIFWQKNNWHKFFNKTKDKKTLDTTLMINNFNQIKSEVNKSYREWQTVKKYFLNNISSSQATSSTTTIDISPEIIDEIKNQLIKNSSSTASTTVE